MALVREFACGQSEAAFETLVARHLDLVYSAARRRVGDAELAGEITQSVFILLARKAGSLNPRTILSGWLYRATGFAAADALKRRRRRQQREQEAYMQSRLNDSPAEDAWAQLAPLLETAMDSLGERERNAVVLRFLDGKSLAEVGAALGVSEEAARMRVSRALEKLRHYFGKRGVTLPAAAIAGAVAGNAVQAAPAGLSGQITAALLINPVVQGTAWMAMTKTIAMITLQKTVVTLTLAVAAGALLYVNHQAAVLRRQVRTLEQTEAAQAGEIEAGRRERDAATHRLALLAAELAQAGSNRLELMKLRGEAAVLRAGAELAATDPAMKMLSDRVALLKQKLAQMPDKKIPELAFVTAKDWVDAAANADLSTDDGVRQALSKLREAAVNTFLNEMMKDAFKSYLAANGNILPANLQQLEPYFSAPVTDDMLARYQLLQSGTPDNNADLVKLATFADPDYDSNHGMSINGAWGGGFNHVLDAVQAAASAFAGDNNGQLPTDASQLTSYLKRPLDAATIQNYLNQLNASPPSTDLLTIAPAVQAYTTAHNGQYPQGAADLQPYITTPAQQAALQQLGGAKAK